MKDKDFCAPLFSVIMPAYNGMKYIDEAVKSVIQQNFDDYELIIVDDASSDGTREYLQKLVDSGNPDAHGIHVILQDTNGGIGNARNTAIAKAAGRYLVFIDQDDTFTPDAFKELNSALAQKGYPDILCYGCNRVDEDGVLIKAFPPELDGKALRWDLCTVWTYAISRSLVTDKNILFPTASMNEDIIFSLQAARYANQIGKLEACIYNYRVNELSTSRHMSRKFDMYPQSRRLVFQYCREAYDAIADEEDRKLIFLTALAYYYSIQFGIFRHDDKATRIKEYRLHREALEFYFGDYLHGHSVTLIRPKCRRFIYRLVVWVSYRMEKYLGKRFFEKFIILMGK